MFSTWPLPFKFSEYDFVGLCVSHARYISCASYPRLDYTDNIWWRVQFIIIKCKDTALHKHLVRGGGVISKQQSSLLLTKRVSSLSNNHSDVNILSWATADKSSTWTRYYAFICVTLKNWPPTFVSFVYFRTRLTNELASAHGAWLNSGVPRQDC